MKATPVIAVALGLASVIVRTEVPVGKIDAGENALATVGAASTVSVAFAATAFVPALAEVTSPAAIVLACAPMVALVTCTLTVQLPAAGIVPPASDTPVAVCEAVPPQVVAAVAATGETLAGWVSVRATPVIAVAALALASVKVSVETPPAPISAGAYDFETAGRATTVNVALAATGLLPALVLVTAPAAIVLACAPGVLPVTFTVTVHEPPAGTVAPESATELPPAAAVTVPPAQVVAPAGVAVFTIAPA